MSIKFTVEEGNLISIFESESRNAVIQSILDVKKCLDDTEMLEVVSKVLEKLDSMSDEEFGTIDYPLLSRYRISQEAAR